MTKKEARDYVASTENWEPIEETEHLRLYRMRFKNLTYWRVDVLRINNLLEVLYKEQNPRTDFRTEQFYEDKGGLIYYDIRPTGIAEAIWKASKA